MGHARSIRDELRLALSRQRAVMKHLTKADYDHERPTTTQRATIDVCRRAAVESLRTLERMLPKILEDVD